MNDGQVKQIVDAIRAHARAMVAGRLWAQAEAGTDVNHVVADADTLLEALSASSGGDTGGAGIPGGGKPEHAAGPGDELTATPPLSADLVTVRWADLVLYLDHSNLVERASSAWDADLFSAMQHLREAVRR